MQTGVVGDNLVVYHIVVNQGLSHMGREVRVQHSHGDRKVGGDPEFGVDGMGDSRTMQSACAVRLALEDRMPALMTEAAHEASNVVEEAVNHGKQEVVRLALQI